MRVRYIGPDAARDLAFPGGCITFDAGKWQDIGDALAGASIPAHHAEIVVRGLGPDWETDDKKKSSKQPAATTPDPAEPDTEEQS